jgi:tetratricopeptide (TPR) repeat protein/transglutaminase-like putative cysteine protease
MEVRMERRIALGLLLALAAAASPVGSPIGGGAAEAQTRRGGGGGSTLWDREQQRLHDEVVRRHDATAVVPLIELGSNWEYAPARTVSLLHALGANRRLPQSIRFYAQTYEVALLRRSGDRTRAAQLSASLGFVRRWRVLGPFDNEGKAGFERAMPPETALDRETDTNAQHEGLERPVHWATLPELGAGESVLLAPFLTPSTDVCAFAETFVEIERARPVAVFAGATGAMRVWWNGAQVIEDAVYREADTDRSVAVVQGRQGWNRILVKVCGADHALELMVRVAEPDGSPLVVPADPDGARLPSAPPATAARLPAVPQTILAALEGAIAAHPDDAAAHEALARYLDYTNGDDPAAHRVRDLSIRATELHATAENLLFAARRQPTRADRLRLVQQAVALAPNDVEVAVEHAALIADGASGERSLAMLEAIPPTSVGGLAAMAVRAHLLASLGFRESAHASYEDLVRRVPGAPYYLRLLADSADRLGRDARAIELRRQILAIRTDDTDIREALVALAVARSEREQALEMVRVEREIHPISSSTMYWASAIYDALGEEDEAIEVLRAAVELDRTDPEAHIALGRALLRLGRRDPALASLREALALRPQDASTRLLVEQIQPEGARADEALATPIEVILARRRPDGEWPATILHDLEVHTVHENGLSGSFRQIVTQIHDDEGARAFRQFGIQYEPSTQWVDVRAVSVRRGDQVLTSYRVGETSLVQPEYRIYYSARQVVITYPVLEPGDVIEVRYRVEDVAVRNEYADYFGVIRGLQRAIPAVRVEQVFVAPASRELHFNVPSIRVARETRTEGATRIDRFSADDVPALRSEPYMPGYAEVAPYLHASTYSTWEQVGRFWWGLSADQLIPDAALERTVRELVAGAPDVRTRVQRIYAWATDRVRYVGLEFGIHGHQPYRVTDVLRHGFGDCKDTASLIYAALRIAGVDARIVLVRTRPNGEIGREPASLAVFDHAIAYVPELDLYLDGTAEHGGSSELPTMDQGALGLVVGPDSVEMRTLPMRMAGSSGRRRELTIELAPDGTARLRASEELRGHDAMTARGSYDAPGTRRERLQRSLASVFTGIEVDEESFELSDREQPVRYTWAAHAPQIGERSGGVVRIPPSTLGNLTQAWAPLPTRRMTLVMGPPFHHRERRVVRAGALPVEDVPPGGVLESPFGRLSIRYTSSGEEVVAETELELLRERVSPAEYAAFREWVEAADALLQQRIAIGGVR